MSWVHATAIVDDGVQLGDGTAIGEWTRLCEGARIGRHCRLGQNVFIGGRVAIGDGCHIGNNVSVHDAVVFEAGVQCGPGVVCTSHRRSRALGGVDNERCTLVCRGVMLGANATVLCGVAIGEFAVVGAGSVVTRDVRAFALVMGVPARQVGWISAVGERLALPLVGNASAICSRSGVEYRLIDTELRSSDNWPSNPSRMR